LIPSFVSFLFFIPPKKTTNQRYSSLANRTKAIIIIEER